MNLSSFAYFNLLNVLFGSEAKGLYTLRLYRSQYLTQLFYLLYLIFIFLNYVFLLVIGIFYKYIVPKTKSALHFNLNCKGSSYFRS